MIDATTYQAVLNQFRSARMDAIRQYPMQEIDASALIYESLDEERHFERDAVTLDEHIAELRELASRAPKGAEVVIEFEQDYGYDDDRITVRKVGYWREPTREERAEREAHNANAREHNAKLQALQDTETARLERAEFERLKAKFDSDSDDTR